MLSMLLDELMHHVSKGWYWLHWAVMVVVNLMLLSGYFLFRLSGNAEIQTTYGLNDAVLYISGFMLFYLFTIYWIVGRKSLALATFLASMMMAMQFVNLFDQTNQSSSSLIYVGIWMIISWLDGMYGLVIQLGVTLVTFMYIMQEIDFDLANIQPVSIVLAISALIAMVLGYLYWRGRFITPESVKVSQLSSMLRSNRRQSEILMESIADGIIVTDTKGIVQLINRAGCELTGWPEKEATGFDARTVLRLIGGDKTGHTIPDNEHPLAQVITKHKHVNETLRLMTRENKPVFISLVISPVILPGTNEFAGTVAVFRDVNKQKVEEQKKVEFISTASHEMRTPVAAIEGYLALAMNENVSKIDDKARSFLQKAHISTQHLGKLFQDLLISAKAEDGRLSSHPEVIEMGQFLSQLSEDLSFAAQKKELETEIAINKHGGGGASKTIQPLYFVHVDPARLREVVTNIFDNAVKYTESGKVSMTLTGNETTIQLSISDTGYGIPPSDLPHLFQKFYRIDNAQTRTVGGTGLGLFICKKIVELYGGQIWVKSKEGEGSTFYINLPRISSQQARSIRSTASKTTRPVVPVS